MVAVRTLVTVAIAFFILLPVNPQAAVAQDDDSALLESYKSGERETRNSFWAIHDNPVAGQGAKYKDFDGTQESFRVAFVRGNVCTVEHQLPASEVVLAYEFEMTGAIAKRVRRAWAGKVGEKPFQAKVAPIKALGAVGLGGGGSSDLSQEPFEEFEQGGRKWNGTLTTIRRWSKSTKKAGNPDSITRVWKSDANWFQQSIREEVEKGAANTAVAQMLSSSSDFPALLDWTEIPAPTDEEERTLRSPVIQSVAAADLERLVNQNLSFGYNWGIHPDAKVGDWAQYSRCRLTLAKLTEERAILECTRPDDELGLVEAMEFKIADGIAVKAIARFAGLRGKQPRSAKYSTWQDQRPLETTTGPEQDYVFAGRTWRGRLVTETRSSLRPKIEGDYKDITETIISEDAPFGRPLSLSSYRASEPDEGYSWELTGLGTDASPALDWSEWQATPE
ncbi:MAG: hypothetical protein KDB90_12305 [Planctomycetes bacterium]|nr:hypothetical protein [Planctomycetota bacterium]